MCSGWNSQILLIVSKAESCTLGSGSLSNPMIRPRPVSNMFDTEFFLGPSKMHPNAITEAYRYVQLSLLIVSINLISYLIFN